MTVNGPGSAAVRSVVGAVLDRASEHPRHLAIDTVEREISYGALVARAGGLARALETAAPTGPVVVLLDDGVELAARALAALSLRRAFVPVPADIDPEALLTLTGILGATAIVASDVERLGAVRSGGPAALIDGSSVVDAPLPRPIGPSGTLSLASTSGSSGTPKVVRLLEEEVLQVLDGTFGSADVQPGDVLAVTLSPATFAVVGLLRALALGVSSVCPDPLGVPLSAIVRTLQHREASFLRLVPSVLRRIVRAVPAGERLEAIRAVQCTGEVLTWADVDAARRVLPETAVIHNRFGMTETGEVAVREVRSDEPLGTGAVPIGRALPGRSFRIERGAGVEAEVDEVGELVLEGAFHRIAPQSEPLEGGGWRLRTGDLGRIDPDGELRLLGRRDRMLKLSGVRVEPAVVEDALRGVEGIGDVAVAPIALSGGESVLVAFVVTAPGAVTEVSALRAAVARCAPAAAVPARFVLRREAFPLLPTGKVDVARLLADLVPTTGERSGPTAR